MIERYVDSPEGSLSSPEIRALVMAVNLARAVGNIPPQYRLDVLELGPEAGLSAAVMAQAGASVHMIGHCTENMRKQILHNTRQYRSSVKLTQYHPFTPNKTTGKRLVRRKCNAIFIRANYDQAGIDTVIQGWSDALKSRGMWFGFNEAGRESADGVLYGCLWFRWPQGATDG